MIAVRNRFTDFGSDVDVAVVTFSPPDYVDRYLDRMQRRHPDSESAPFPFLIDSERRAYDAYGLTRASTPRIYGWRVGLRYRQILKEQGRSALRRPVDDIHQLGGDFVIDPNGVLSYGRWSRGPADRPPVAHLLAATRLP